MKELIIVIILLLLTTNAYSKSSFFIFRNINYDLDYTQTLLSIKKNFPKHKLFKQLAPQTLDFSFYIF
jgi:uncharacterized protein YxeA